MVTPVDTGGRVPIAGQASLPGALNPDAFDSSPASPDGNSYLYTADGPVPGAEGDGTGWVNEYRAVRGEDGWTSTLFSPTGADGNSSSLGGNTPNQDYSFMRALGDGALSTGSQTGTSYLRTPDGTLHLLGEGTIPASPDTDGIDNGTVDDPNATGRWISPDGEHVIFVSGQAGVPPAKLLPQAPAPPVSAVYDRTPQGLKLVSVLPGENVPASDSYFRGASDDGSVVLFSHDSAGSSPLTGQVYARLNNEETVEVADPEEGFPSGGRVACLGGPSSASLDYRWLRNGTPIPGENESSYETSPTDDGAVIQCQVFATTANSGSTATMNSYVVPGAPVGTTSPPVPPSGNLLEPTPDAPLTVGGVGGQTLTCNSNAIGWFGAPSFTYQWYRNGVELSGNGADTETYTVQAADLADPATFQCVVTGTNADGTAIKASAIRETIPAPTGPEASTATAENGGTSRIAPAGVFGQHKAFYVHYGSIYSVDLESGQRDLLVDSGDARPVNISADGSHVVFLSWQQLDGTNGEAGSPNLYIHGPEGTKFIAVVPPVDLLSQFYDGVQGLDESYDFDEWSVISGSSSGRTDSETGPLPNAFNPTQVTEDGSTLVFQTKSQATSYDSNGQPEIYRYETASASLVCVSCPPNGEPATHGANLQTNYFEDKYGHGLSSVVHNLSEDGNSVVFESKDDLVPRDSDGRADVYQWQDGELSLLTDGNSSQDESLLGATPDARTVFFRTASRLIPNAQDPGLRAVYAARVNGGLLSQHETDPNSGGCSGEDCQETSGTPPIGYEPGSGADLSGNPDQPGADCSVLARKAKTGLAKARKLRKRAKRASGKQARKLRRKASKQRQQARKLGRQAERCEGESR